MKFFVSLVLSMEVTGLGGIAWAQAPQPQAGAPQTLSFKADKAVRFGPCYDLRDACIKAGFTPDGHKKGGKGLYVDCMSKIKAGESVTGVKIDAAKVQACNDTMDHRRLNREKKKADLEAKRAEKAASKD